MRAILTLFIFTALAVLLSADAMPPSPMIRAASRDISKIARIELPARSGVSSDEPVASLYTFDASVDSYRRYARFGLGEAGAAEFLFITDDGDHLILISIVQLDRCVRLYFRDGRLLKTWSLSDILTEKEIRSLPQGGAHTPWFRSGLVYNDHLEMSGRMSFREGDSIGYDFVLDFRKLKIQKKK